MGSHYLLRSIRLYKFPFNWNNLWQGDLSLLFLPCATFRSASGTEGITKTVVVFIPVNKIVLRCGFSLLSVNSYQKITD